jgi:integrase
MATVKLTDRQVASARADEGQRLELWDAATPGLALRVTDQGRKTWIVRYRTADGRQPRLTLGTYPTLSLAEARDRAGAAIRSARDGGDPAGEKRRARSAAAAQPIKTMEQLAAAYFTASEAGEYVPRGKRKRAATIAEERRLWRAHLSPALGELRPEDVTPALGRKVLRALAASGRGVTANRTRSLLRQIFNFALREERLVANPVARIAPLAAETPRERVLSDDELKGAWAAITAPSLVEKVSVGPAVSIALRLLLLTLTRRAEVAGMRRVELDPAQAVWTIPGERTKNGRAVLVPLSTEAVQLIREALALADEGEGRPSPFVFPSPRNRERSITPASLSHALREIRLALGLPRFTPHDLRRTAATIMASERLGVSPFLIGRLLNHTSETGGAAKVTLKVYALHEFAAEKRRALEAWAGLLLEIVGERAPPSNVHQLHGAVA